MERDAWRNGSQQLPRLELQLSAHILIGEERPVVAVLAIFAWMHAGTSDRPKVTISPMRLVKHIQLFLYTAHLSRTTTSNMQILSLRTIPCRFPTHCNKIPDLPIKPVFRTSVHCMQRQEVMRPKSQPRAIEIKAWGTCCADTTHMKTCLPVQLLLTFSIYKCNEQLTLLDQLTPSLESRSATA